MLRTRGTDRTFAFRALSRRSQAYSMRGAEPNSRSDISAAEPLHASQTPQRQNSNASPSVDLESFGSRLKDWGVLTSSSLRRRAEDLSQKATSSFSHLGQHLNRATGYEEIDALKRQVVEQEARIKATRRAARDAKTAHDDAVLQRSVSQRQINDLLQRKSSWTDHDVSHFTSLVRSDHSLEQEEVRTKARVAETEDALDREFSELMKVILARYHEEQVWSDKIRSASTYGSLAVLGVNLVVFIMAIIVVEPWKRKRLAQTFEKKVEELGAETKAVMGAGATRIEEQLKGHEKLLAELITRVSAESRQGSSAVKTTSKEAFPEDTTTVVPPRSSSWWWQYFSPQFDEVPYRELIVVVGSAAAGTFILLCRSLFARN